MLAALLEMNHGHIANMIKGYALAIGVVYAIYVVATWWTRKTTADRIDRQTRATQAFARYLERAIEHPDLARPQAGDAAKTGQRASYPWFVGYLLASAEEILLLDPTQQWRETLSRHLAPHRGYLASAAFRDGAYRDLSPALKGLVDALPPGEAAVEPAAGLRAVAR